jgi:hypothetical protein
MSFSPGRPQSNTAIRLVTPESAPQASSACRTFLPAEPSLALDLQMISYQFLHERTPTPPSSLSPAPCIRVSILARALGPSLSQLSHLSNPAYEKPYHFSLAKWPSTLHMRLHWHNRISLYEST